MAVIMPGGDELLSSQWFSEVAVEVLGRSLPVDLRVLKMHDFDVIFEMDWLSRHRTILTALSAVSCSVLLESVSFPFEVVSPYAVNTSCLFLRCVALFVLLAPPFLPAWFSCLLENLQILVVLTTCLS